MKNYNIKSSLSNLNQRPNDRAFLDSFRGELNSFVQARPIERAGFFMVFTKTATVFGLVIFLVLSGGGLVFASQGSLPGQLLYPVKIATEEARIAITTRPEKREALKVKFINKRISEVLIISREKNINNNAQKALTIIDKKIEEIERFEAEDKKNQPEENKVESKFRDTSTKEKLRESQAILEQLISASPKKQNFKKNDKNERSKNQLDVSTTEKNKSKDEPNNKKFETIRANERESATSSFKGKIRGREIKNNNTDQKIGNRQEKIREQEETKEIKNNLQ